MLMADVKKKQRKYDHITKVNLSAISGGTNKKEAMVDQVEYDSILTGV